MAEFCIAAGFILIFWGFCGLLLWYDAKDIDARRARGEHIEPPSMWP